MSNVVKQLADKGLISPPAWLPTNTMFLTIIGSHAYGVADTSVRDKIPDYDVYGFAIPPKNMIFKHLAGYIDGFGPEPPTFNQWQKHGIIDQEDNAGKGKEWDFQLFNIVKFFELCRKNNPNMIDALFTPENCVIHCTQVGRMVKDNRKIFLSKLCWPRFRGYAHEQLKKMNDKNPTGKRKELVDKWGYDIKYAYHIIRLFDEIEQILTTGDLDLQRAREPMKAVRRGDWTAEEVRQWAMEKERSLESLYAECNLPIEPPIEPIRQLLINCLEEHYGSIGDCVAQIGWAEESLKKIDLVLDGIRRDLYK